MDTLEQFIHSNPHPRELKRALAVQMSQYGYGYREIQQVLQVSLGFISHCNQRYDALGVEGLKSNYHGTQGYLSAAQKQQVFSWLQTQDYWTIEDLVDHLQEDYGVSYTSSGHNLRFIEALKTQSK